MDEEDFPRRTRRSGAPSQEKGVKRKDKDKKDEDRMLFQEDKPKRASKRNAKQPIQTTTQDAAGHKAKKMKKAKGASGGKKSSINIGDDDDDDDDEDDLHTAKKAKKKHGSKGKKSSSNIFGDDDDDDADEDDAGHKAKKLKKKQTSKEKKSSTDIFGDDDNDDVNEDDLGLKFLDGSDDDDDGDDYDSDDEESTKPKTKVKKEQKKEKKATKKKKKTDNEEEESDVSSDDDDDEEAKKKKVKPLKGSLDEDVEAIGGKVRQRPYVNLTQKTITTDMLLLAVVKEVRDYEIVLSLPGGCSGFLPITNISDIYTKHLEKLSRDEDDDDDSNEESQSIPKPKDIFRVGSLVACKVKSVESTPTGRPRIQVSVKPSDVNANLIPSMLKEGMVVNGCISSKEDHGYMVDIGVNKVQAFLGWKDTRRFETERNMGQPLYMGQPIQCLISRVQGNGRSLVLKADPSEVAEPVANKDSHNALQSLLPGTKVMATVIKSSGDHLKVTVLEKYSGHIAQLHLEDNSFPTDHYKPQQQVTTTVICNNQATKTLTLSMNQYHHANQFEARSPFAQIKQGTMLEEARVLRVDTKYGLLVKVNNKLNGIVHQSQLPEKDAKKMTEVYRSGQKVKCRILDFNWFDAVAVLSMKKSTLEKPFLGYHSILPGVVLEGSIQSFSDKGVKVQVADRTFGFVPNSHMADIPISKPKDKYKVGDRLKLKVLTVDAAHRRLVLTHKKTLVESSLPTITAYDQVDKDMMVHGVIVAVKDFGCIVGFYNDVKGLIPKGELSSDPTLIASQAFHFGQVVKCKVIETYHPSVKKITLSLRKTEVIIAERPPANADVTLGQVERVKVTKVTHNGLEVAPISDESSKGFIPTMHLSDYHDNCLALLASYRAGSIIDEAMYWGYARQKLCHIFTCKHSILKTAGHSKMVTNLKELESGMMLMGHVKRIMDYGVFVEANSNLVGLAPKAALSDDFTASTENCFEIGHTVRAQVTQVDKVKGRFLVSLRSSQYPPESNEGMHLLGQYLSEREELCKRLEKGDYKYIVKLTTGTSVTARVNEVQDDGRVICSLPHDITGILTQVPDDAEFEEGDEINVCVLHNNIQDKTALLTVNPELVANGNTKKSKTPKKGAKGKGKKQATVEFVHEHFVLAFITGEGFVYLPGRQHLNEIQLGKDKLSVGQTLNVALKSIVNGRQLAEIIRERSKKTEEKVEVRLTRAEKLDQAPELQIGQMVTATIKSVKDLQLYVTTDTGIYGRVHATEITDDMLPGTIALESFKEGDQIQAKVIGHREIREHKFLPITHTGFRRMGLELSMKKSVLEKEEVDEVSIEDQLASYETGQTVMVIVHKYHKNMLWVALKAGITGKVFQLNLSQRVSVLNNPLTFFKPGSIHEAQVLSVDKEQHLVELTMAGNTSAAELSVGSVLNGHITKIQQDMGLHVKLHHGLHGIVNASDIHDRVKSKPLKGFKKHQCVRCYVLSCNDKENIKLSMKPSMLDHKSSRKTGNQAMTISDVKKGQELEGIVKNHSADEGLILSLSTDLVGFVSVSRISSLYHIESTQLLQAFPIGKILHTKVLSVDIPSKRIELSCCHDDTGMPDQTPTSFQTRRKKKRGKEPGKPTKKTKRGKKKETEEDEMTDKEETDGDDERKSRRVIAREVDAKPNIRQRRRRESDSDSGVENDAQIEVITKGSSDRSTAPRLQVSAGFTWDDDVTMTTIKTKPAILKRDEEEERSSSSSSSSSEDESEEEAKEEKPVKKSKKEIAADKKEEEEYLYKTERALMDNERTPETTEDFDRLVLSSPDSSLVWIRYMAYHLHSAEVDKARTVAERALKAISFREEQEKLNVWVAYMNLENIYGAEESLMQVFERALQFSEPIKVFQQLVNIYIRTEKIEAAEQLYGSMVKRFNFNKDVWINFGMFLMKHSKQDTARRLMQRSFKSLREKQHVDIIVKFGQMEFKYGEVERGKTMFENVLSNYPKRTDIWSVYLDMMIKTGDTEATRHVFERVIHLTLSAKKMKFFFKRYLDFEKKYGTESTVDSVKQKAVEYVESKTAVAAMEES